MKIHILIVDDCPVMRMIIRRTINMCEFPIVEIHEAENGREGLKFLEKYPINLAIIDLNMPVMNGAEMIARMRTSKETAKIPVLTVSAESNEVRQDIISGLTQGFVHKPFSAEALRDKLLKILEKESIIRTGAYKQ